MELGDAEKYCADSRLHVIFEDLAKKVLESKPHDPLKFMIEYLEELRSRNVKSSKPSDPTDLRYPSYLDDSGLSIIVFGASGDLAKKKTYPALQALFAKGLIPKHTKIVGYSRTSMTDSEFRERLRPYFPKKEQSHLEPFFELCTYLHGSYSDPSSFQALNNAVAGYESAHGGSAKPTRLFYLALPPNVFEEVTPNIRNYVMPASATSRIIIEKPFGKDAESSAALAKHMTNLFDESQIYRIDHYLGKEMVQTISMLRFSNKVFSKIWDSTCISTVQITFKEPFGTEGRGGYFDSFGIIRDIMQNHLLQVLCLVAMEKPKSLDTEAIRDEKVHVLRSVEPLKLSDVVLGQYIRADDGSKEAYIEDPTVPNDSLTPTFCMAVLQIRNDRWNGVPFILKAGKALGERKAEVRIQFKPEIEPFKAAADPNELVIRIQPDEAIYLKANAKQPGLAQEAMPVELDLSYSSRFSDINLPDAYESLIFDAIVGSGSNFVRSDELAAAWAIFTPLLHTIEQQKVKPIPYHYGSRGPRQADEVVERCGYVRSQKYKWVKGKI